MIASSSPEVVSERAENILSPEVSVADKISEGTSRLWSSQFKFLMKSFKSLFSYSNAVKSSTTLLTQRQASLTDGCFFVGVLSSVVCELSLSRDV
jgi:hypothetical protein